MAYRTPAAKTPRRTLDLGTDLSAGILLYFLILVLGLLFGSSMMVTAIRASLAGKAFFGFLFGTLFTVSMPIMLVRAVMDLASTIRLSKQEDNLHVEWRRFGVIRRSLEVPQSSVSVTLGESLGNRGGRFWTVILGNSVEDIPVGGPYGSLKQAEERRRLVAYFLRLERNDAG